MKGISNMTEESSRISAKSEAEIATSQEDKMEQEDKRSSVRKFPS